MTNQSDRQQSVRDITGTELTYEGDWHALFDDAGIAAGAYNGRLLAWINLVLGESYTEINGAMNAFAASRGVQSWNDLSDIVMLTGKKIVTLGTSITDQGYQTPSESASTVGWTGRGWDAWARFLNNQNADWVNKGVAGNSIDDMIARFDADVVAEDPYAVIVEAGTNDAGQTYETIIGDLTTLYGLVTSNGYVLVPLTIPMREVAGGWNDTVRDKVLDVNTWIKANYSNAIEVNEFFSDPSTDRPYALYTEDGTHPSNIGAYALGRAVAAFLSTHTTDRDIITSGTAVNANAGLTGAGGSFSAGITGTVPTTYRVDVVGGHSGTAVATALDPGLQLVFTPGATGSVEDYDVRMNPIDTTVTLSEAYELLSDITVSDWDGWAYIKLRLYDPGISAYYDLLQIMNDETYIYPEGEYSGIMRTPPFTAGTTTMRVYLQVGIKDDATGTGTLTIDNFKLRVAE